MDLTHPTRNPWDTSYFNTREGLRQNDPESRVVRVHADDVEFVCARLLVDRIVTYRDAVYGDADPDRELIECDAEGWNEIYLHAKTLAAFADALEAQKRRLDDTDPAAAWHPATRDEGEAAAR